MSPCTTAYDLENASEVRFLRRRPSGSHGGSVGVRLGLEDEIKPEKCQGNCERAVGTV